jgi:hypothetical protein
MADVASTLAGWSSTTSSNSPSGSTSIATGLDDNLRELQGVVVRGLSHKGADIASATTTDIGAVEGLAHDITGTTTITGLGTVRAGIWKLLKFEGALTLTHNATSLILPGGDNITTADGDMAIMFSEGSGNWRCYAYFKAATGALIDINGYSADATPDVTADYVVTYDASATAIKKVLLKDLTLLRNGTATASTSGTAVDFTSIPSWVKRITVQLVGVSTNGTGSLMLRLGDAGGVETSGYLSGAQVSATLGERTDGFILTNNFVAANACHGQAILTLQDASAFTWACTSNVYIAGTGVYAGAGTKSLSATLDRIRVDNLSGDTFDAGSINILYE